MTELELDTTTEAFRTEGLMLYHGSPIPSIESLRQAEEATIGSGVYFADNFVTAEQYARHRCSRLRKAEKLFPTVYVAQTVEDKLLANLNNPEVLDEVMHGFRGDLESLEVEPNNPWFVPMAIDKAVRSIKEKRYIKLGLKEVTFCHGEHFSRYLGSIGFGGLVGAEGGEGRDVQPHNTHLIFSEASVRLVEEVSLNSKKE